MPLEQFNLDAFLLGTGTAEGFAGSTVNLSSFDRDTYQWQNDTDNGNNIRDLDFDGNNDSTQPTADEGVLVNGTLQQIETSGAYRNSTLTFSDGQSFNLPIITTELEDGTVLAFFRDGDIADFIAAGYDFNDITGITLGNFRPNNARRPERFDDEFPVCFLRGTLIETDQGLRAVEDLKIGDRVRTRDRGLQPIRWIGSRELAKGELAAMGNAYPVRIDTGALGNGLPERPLIVSPQHRVLATSTIVQRMFDEDAVLVAAKHLLSLPGIDECRELDVVEYWHFMFDRHEIVFAEGAEVESFYAGPQALKSLPDASREEVLTLFPELRDADLPVPAAFLVGGRRGGSLARRHASNAKPLLS